MFKWLKKLFNDFIIQKKCLDDKTKTCTYDYRFDRNGSLCVYGNLYGCCRVKRQIEAAARLGDKLKLKNYD